MPGAVIVINQPAGAGAGTPGQARNDLWQSKQVELQIGTGGNINPVWTLLDKPPGSSSTLNNPNTTNATFTPDLVGTYRIQLTVNGGGPGNVQVKVARVRKSSTGTTANRGWAYPAKGEVAGENDYGGNTRGWAEPFEFILEDIRQSIAGGGTTFGTDLETIDASHQKVIGFRGKLLTPGTPAHGDTWKYDSVSDTYKLGAGGGGQGTSTLIFRPGGVAADNVYTNWGLMMVAFNATKGDQTIQIDDTLGAAIVPSGTHDFQGRVLLKGMPNGNTGLVFSQDAIIRDATKFEDIYLNGNSDTYILIPSYNQTVRLIFDRCTLSTSNAGTPLIQLTDGPTNKLILRGNTFFYGSDDQQLVEVLSGQVLELDIESGTCNAYVINSEPGAILILDIYEPDTLPFQEYITSTNTTGVLKRPILPYRMQGVAGTVSTTSNAWTTVGAINIKTSDIPLIPYIQRRISFETVLECSAATPGTVTTRVRLRRSTSPDELDNGGLSTNTANTLPEVLEEDLYFGSSDTEIPESGERLIMIELRRDGGITNDRAILHNLHVVVTWS